MVGLVERRKESAMTGVMMGDSLENNSLKVNNQEG
jgi:hypothetical protein